MPIEERIIRGLKRLQCDGIRVTHDGAGKVTLAGGDKDADERALAIAATKTTPGVTEVRFQNGKL